jgi:ATP:ADP antiporter, AAA family
MPRNTHSLFSRMLGRVVRVEEREIPALLWGFAQMFCLLAGNYVFRPIRESLGSARGSVDLKYLYLGTFAATLLSAWAWSALVARVPVRRFMVIAYEFFALSFLVFWALLSHDEDAQRQLLTGYAFFVWYSVYNVFIVSVFWSRAADLFSLEQGRRMFPFMAAGASLGAIVGSSATKTLVGVVGTIDLLLIPVLLLQLALFCARGLAKASEAARPVEVAVPAGALRDAPVRGAVWAGLKQVFASPLLAMIAVYVLSASICGTCFYNAQNDLAREAFPARNDRTEYFATVDLAVNIIAFLSEAFLTARIIAWIGVGAALFALPTAYVFGLSTGSAFPTIGVVAAFVVTQRSIAYGLTTPAREALFTVVPREEKYKAKNAIDTFVWRGGDAAAVWLLHFALLASVGTSAAPATKATVFLSVGIPVALLWLLAAWRLRRIHREQASMSGG